MFVTLMTESPYMTPSELVKRFKNAFTERGLKKWRWRRSRNREGEKGPAFVRVSGAIRYHIDDVNEWERTLRGCAKKPEDTAATSASADGGKS